MPRPKPTPQARALAEGLRVERRAARLAMTEVADKLAWSQSTISRMETGVRPASAEEVSALLAVYQVTGERRDALLTLSRDIDRSNWLETRDAGVYGQAKILAQYELDATRIIESCTSLLPVLLQTPPYARVALVASGVPAEEVEAARRDWSLTSTRVPYDGGSVVRGSWRTSFGISSRWLSGLPSNFVSSRSTSVAIRG